MLLSAARGVLVAINTAHGSRRLHFGQGPYSSAEQELWYRYGFLGFFLAGSVLPGAALYARRSAGLITTATAWMLWVLMAFL